MLPKRSFLSLNRKLPNLKYLFFYLLAIAFIFFIVSSLKINKIICLQNNKTCDIVYQDLLNKKVGSSLINISFRQTVKDLNMARPTSGVDVHFKLFNTLLVNITNNQKSLDVNLTLVSEYPKLSMDSLPESSTSGVFFNKPSTEIKEIFSDLASTSFSLWSNGELTPASSSEAKIKYFITEKPSTDILIDLYNLTNLLLQYTDPENIYIIDKNVFLSRSDQPDIITSVPFEQTALVEALQSLGFFTTIKKDTKIIDLRFKNPTIR